MVRPHKTRVWPCFRGRLIRLTPCFRVRTTITSTSCFQEMSISGTTRGCCSNPNFRGNGADWELWITDRNRCRLAGAQPRRWPHAAVLAAFLLGRDDSTKVIGRLREPLLKPNEHEREGYVPNIVYTCGAILYRGDLITPYGMADHATGFATVAVAEVLAAMDRTV